MSFRDDVLPWVVLGVGFGLFMAAILAIYFVEVSAR